ncbi:MAG: LysR family transcriptional regulator [Oceanospirillaceae bacterium]|nr:LysR family transcriptional regulator [Oceanospirillaceae bacterium]
MNIRQLEAFRAVMLTGSATLAGKTLFISQPAVSRLIMDLEYNLGFKLFTRLPNKLLPTSEAQSLFIEVDRSFIGLAEIGLAAKAIKNNQLGKLKIVVTPLVINSFMVDMVSDFLTEHPDISIDLEVAPKIEAAHLMRGLQIDFAILPLPAAHEVGIASLLLAEHEAVCVLPINHPLAVQESIDIKDLHGHKYISLSAGSPLRASVDGLFQQHSIEPQLIIETRHQHSILQFVQRGVGVAILDPLILTQGTDNVCIRPLTPKIAWKYALVYSQNKPLSLLAETFIKQLLKYFSAANLAVASLKSI